MVVYRGTGKKRVIKTNFGKIEILGQGQQFVAYGIHPDGAPFEWLNDEPAAKRLNGRVVGEADLDRLEAALHAALGGNQPGPEQIPASPAIQRVAAHHPIDSSSPFREINDRALANLAAWVPSIFPRAKFQPSTGAFRVSSKDLGRTLQEDLSIHPGGVQDFGEERPRTPIDVVMEWGGAADSAAGAQWLAERLGVEFSLLREVPPTVVEAAALMAAPKPARAKPVDPLAALHPGVDWRAPRGLIGQISDWILETSRRPNRPLAVAAGTAVMSGLCGRWLYGPTGSAVNLYIAALAKTGAGKDRPLSAISEVLAAAGVPEIAQTAKAFSVSGFEGLIRDHPCCVATTDEIGANLLARIANKRASHEAGEGIKAALLELWSRVYGKAPFRTTRRAQSASEAIASPALTIFGASTPEAFFETFKAGDALSGFMNRFIIAEGAARATQANEFDYVAPSSTLIETIRAILPEQEGNLGDAMGVYRAPAVVERKQRWADEATKREALALENAIGSIAEDHQRGELMARTFEYSVRLASLHAMSQTRWAVDRDDLAWGASWAIGSTQAMVAAAGDLMAETEHESAVNRVKAIIRKEKMIGRSDLVRRTQFLKSRDLSAILEQLAEAEIIEKLEVRTGERGAPSRRYRWIG